MQKANFALHSAEEATLEIPGLGDVGLPMEVGYVMRAVARKAGLTEAHKVNFRNLLPQRIAVFSERPGRTVLITNEN